MSSNSFQELPASSSPISRVPYDVLREIFINCLPRNPDEQPNTTIAPMLLCHVCPSWRTVALNSATLWSHLSYSLTVYSSGERKDKHFVVPEKAVEFIQWWKTNQGSIPPFLYLGVIFKETKDPDQKFAEDDSGMIFFLDYIASAQHLKIDDFYWHRIEERIEGGHQVIFPNLHTLVEFWYFPLYDVSPMPLRRLALSDILQSGQRICILQSRPNILMHCSLLTHISLKEIPVTVAFWFSLIRAVPALQWGHFDIQALLGPRIDTGPPHCTLHHLSACFIYAASKEIEFPLKLLFTNLYLPALRTLSLTSTNHYLLPEMYNVLESTPAVTKLVIGCTIGYGVYCKTYEAYMPNLTSMVGDVNAGPILEPLWKRIPYLQELELELPPSLEVQNRWTAKVIVDFLLKDIIFSPTNWLDLENPECPIKTITLIDISLFEMRGISDYLISSVQKKVGCSLSINFPEVKTGDDLDGAWREWGSRA